MTVYIGADHRGFEKKIAIKSWLEEKGYKVVDCGAHVYDKDDDFPDLTFPVADGVAGDPKNRGIVLCGSAGGVTIAANKVKGIRAAAAFTVPDVIFNREHDDINVLAIPADNTDNEIIHQMTDAFLKTPFSTEPRHARRLSKISQRES